MTTLRLWWQLAGHERSATRAPTLLAVIAFAVTSTAALIAVSGMSAFGHRANFSFDTPSGLYYGLALVAVGLLSVPVLTLGGLAARLAVARRNNRLAGLRLVGATNAQVAGITIVDAVAQALLGALAGLVGFLVLLPLLGRIPFEGQRFGTALWPGFPAVAGTLAVVVLAAVGSGLAAIALVAVSPLGVVNRATPRRLSVLRLIVGLAIVATWMVAPRFVAGHPQVLILLLVAAVAAVNLIGPYLVMVAGLVTASVAKRPAGLLAARRIVDDPRSAWRTVSTTGLAIMLAALSTASTWFSVSPEAPYLPADLTTGSVITLVIVAVLAATTSGVVQAAKVFDAAGHYRALAVIGADPRLPHQARTLEVAFPLLATVGTVGGLVALILAPFSLAVGPDALLRYLVAVTAAVVLTMTGLLASGPLVTQAVRG